MIRTPPPQTRRRSSTRRAKATNPVIAREEARGVPSLVKSEERSDAAIPLPSVPPHAFPWALLLRKGGVECCAAFACDEVD
jgi:hypothetical protein